MLKGYYIYFGSNSNGVLRKIDMQINEFNKEFDVSKIQVYQRKRTFFEKVLSCFPTVSIGYDYDKALHEIIDPDFIYLRRMTADASYVDFFRKIKKKYPNCKTMIEIPTYPYFRDSYFHNAKHLFRSLPYYLKDCIYTRKLEGCVDRVITFSQKEKIYGIPTIRTMNGINVASCRVVSSTESDDTINLISVAMLAPHHGYERIIQGLHNYYENGGKRNIVYHCVGYGEEYDYYNELVQKYGLSDHVVLYGKKAGEELDEIYNIMHIAMDSFGAYKEHIYYHSSLKVREYIARGLPVVSGVKSDVFIKYPTEYYLEYPNDPTSLDMNKIVDFYDRIYVGNDDAKSVHQAIHEYAARTVDYSIVMKEVIDFVKEGKN